MPTYVFQKVQNNYAIYIDGEHTFTATSDGNRGFTFEDADLNRLSDITFNGKDYYWVGEKLERRDL